MKLINSDFNPHKKGFTPIIQFLDEIWLPITDYAVPGIKEGHYLISNYGRVYNCMRGVLLPQRMIRDYPTVTFGVTVDNRSKNKKVHRILMLTFCPISNSNEMQVNHIDGHKWNNHISNLEWATASQNIQHAFDNDLNHKGVNHYSAIYTEDQIRIICQGIQDRVSYRSIAALAGLEYVQSTSKLINEIKSRRIWKHISKDYIFPTERGNQTFTTEEIAIICECIANGIEDRRQMLGLLGIDYDALDAHTKHSYTNTISKIKRKHFIDIVVED